MELPRAPPPEGGKKAGKTGHFRPVSLEKWVTSIHQAIQYIEEHLREELAIQEIAQQAVKYRDVDYTVAALVTVPSTCV